MLRVNGYVEVNERIKAFWQLCPDGKIVTEILTLENEICVIKASIYEDKKDEEPRATGTAYEKEGSTFINKTSYIENCETSAVGRALGNAGIGIDTSVASADEVQNAIIQQDGEKPITKVQVDALYGLIKNRAIENDEVLAILKEKGYSKLADIKNKDFGNIAKQFENFRRD